MSDDWNEGQHHQEHGDHDPGEQRHDAVGDEVVVDKTPLQSEEIEYPVDSAGRQKNLSWRQVAAILEFQNRWLHASPRQAEVFRSALNVSGTSLDIVRRLYPSEGRIGVYEIISAAADRTMDSTKSLTMMEAMRLGMEVAGSIGGLDIADTKLLITALNGLLDELVGDSAERIRWRRNITPTEVAEFLISTLSAIQSKDPSAVEHFRWVDDMLKVWPHEG